MPGEIEHGEMEHGHCTTVQPDGPVVVNTDAQVVQDWRSCPGQPGPQPRWVDLADPEPSRCAQCGATAPAMLRCRRCKAARYCGTECQAKHWKAHKRFCKAVSAPPPLEVGLGNPLSFSCNSNGLSYT